jgi:hypothetical protein
MMAGDAPQTHSRFTSFAGVEDVHEIQLDY